MLYTLHDRRYGGIGRVVLRVEILFFILLTLLLTFFKYADFFPLYLVKQYNFSSLILLFIKLNTF